MIIFATDLDRTLLPNGKEEYDNTLSNLFSIIKDKQLILVYVTGRSLSLFEDAVDNFKIEMPDYLIGDVGTMIYKKNNNKLIIDNEWLEYLKINASNWDVEKIKDSLHMNKFLSLQEKSKQNKYKLSYYLNDISQKNKIVLGIEKDIKDLNMDGDVIYSFDPLKDVGLVDILPKIATKVTALEFLRKRMNEIKDNLIFCGDSGNDVLALINGYKSILVKNASEDVKKEVIKINKEKGLIDRLYIANGTDKMNGNYSSGIIEGLSYFKIL